MTAHVVLLQSELEEVAARPLRSRIALIVGCALGLALSTVPAAVAVLLFTRPDLFLAP